jgi:RNA polymerase-associated protein RTF1
MEMETDEDDEDGQIGREEQEEERERRLLGASTSSHGDKPMTTEELGKVWLSRDAIAKHCMAPWFEDYVKGAWRCQMSLIVR